MANRELETIDEEIRKEKEKYLESTAKTIKHKSKKAGSLLRAAHKGKESKIVALLTKEVDINCKDIEREETPLHYAATAGHNTVVDYLLVKGANVNLVNAKGQNAVHKAAYFDHYEIIRTLSSYGADLNAEDNEGMSPLFLALSRNAHNSVACLIQCGADYKSSGGKSKQLIALHEASSRGFVKAVKTICERCEPDYINHQNAVGNTALHIAVLNSRTGVIALLLGYKISTQIRNSNGFTAADLATTSGFHEIANVIAKSAEQKPSNAPPVASHVETNPVQNVQTCQGYLLILSENKKKWAKHYFQIRDGLLFEYERQGGDQVNVHNLFGSTLKQLQANLPYCFEVSSASTNRIVLKALTNEELNTWVTQLQNHANPEKTLKASRTSNRLSASNNQSVDSEIRKYNESMTKASLAGATWDSLLQTITLHSQSLEVEYEWILLEEREMAKSQTLCSDAMLPSNRKKNRYNNFLPYNSTRVPLSEIPGVEGSDYINANYVTFEGHTFIATQAPLPHTVEDFYKMIWEHCSPAIVMLAPFREGTRVTAHDYLPKPNQPLEMETYPIRITLLEQTAFPFYTLSVLNFELMQKTGQDDNFVVKHFHINNWHENGVVQAPELLDVVEQVRDVAKAHPEFPITVHCSSGMSQTGVWLFVSGYLQKFETCLSNNTIPMINVMQAVELLRSQRTGLVTHMDQYQFLYHFVLSQLQLIGSRKNSREAALPPPLWAPPDLSLLPDLPAIPSEPVETPSPFASPLMSAVPAATIRRSIMITSSPKNSRKSLRSESSAPPPSGSVSKKSSFIVGVKAAEPPRPSILPRSNTVSSPSLPAREDSVPPSLPLREDPPPPLQRTPSDRDVQRPPPMIPVRDEPPPPLLRTASDPHVQRPPPVLPAREDPPPPIVRTSSDRDVQRPPPMIPVRDEPPPPLLRTASDPHVQRPPPVLPARDEGPPLPAREETGPALPAREEPKASPRPFGQSQLRSSGQRPPATTSPPAVNLNAPAVPARDEPPRPKATGAVPKHPSLTRDTPPPPLLRAPSDSKIQPLLRRTSDNNIQPPPAPPRDQPPASTISRVPSDTKPPATPPREDSKPPAMPPREEPKQPVKEEPPWKLKQTENKPPPATPPRDDPPRLGRAPSETKIVPSTPPREEPPQPRLNKTTSTDLPPSTPPREEPPQPRLNKALSSENKSKEDKPAEPIPVKPLLNKVPSSDNKLVSPLKPPATENKPAAPTPTKQNSFTVTGNPFLAKDKATAPPNPSPKQVTTQPKAEEPKPVPPKAEEPKPTAQVSPAPKVSQQSSKQEFSLLEWLRAIEMEHLLEPLTQLGADNIKNLEVLTAEDLGEVNLKPLEKKRLLLEIGKLLQTK